MRYLGDDHVVRRGRGSSGFLCTQVYSAAEDSQSHKVSPFPSKDRAELSLIVILLYIVF